MGAFLSGCATYQSKVEAARRALASEDPSKATALLEPMAKQEGKDQLVYLLDYATALQRAGRYQESAKAFGLAEQIADLQDYHSLSKVTSSLLLSEEMIQYKGDDYEKVLINAMNAVNYLEMNQLDEALVEVRRLNTKLYKYKYEGKRDYEQNPFAFYLSAIIWEADHKWDDAYIAYKQAHDVIPDYPLLREDLIRSALRAQRAEDLAKWRKQFPEVKIRPEWTNRDMGEIILIYQQGWGPRKFPRPESPRFPKLFPVTSNTWYAHLLIDGVVAAKTSLVFSVEDMAIKTLDDDYARLVASRVGGVVAKAAVADQIGQKNAAFGQLAWIAMNVADRADLRQWSTLPKTFQIARVFVAPGFYKVSAVGLSQGHEETSERMSEREIEVRPGRKTFLSWRSFQ